MKKVRISELKNRLRFYLNFVRRGHSVLVYDRDRAIARIDPIGVVVSGETSDWIAELEHARVLAPPTSVLPADWTDRRVIVPADVVGALLEERESGR